MAIEEISIEELRKMNGKEGLILQGCGGDPKEWLDGINNFFHNTGILKDNTQFTNIKYFQNGGLTNVLFPFDDDVSIDIGKLSVWRIETHQHFGGTWLSDYVENQLGGFIDEPTESEEEEESKGENVEYEI